MQSVTIETRGDRPLCVGCGGAVKVKDRRDVEHADLPCFGRPTVLVWRKIRWECSIGCGAKSSTETAAAIAAPRQRLTDRAGRWATVQVGRRGRPVSDVGSELGAGWDPVMDAVVGFGQVLIDDPGRFGDVEAIGLDETLRCKTGRWKAWHASGVTNGPTEAVIIWSLFGRVFHVADEGCRGRGGRVLWSGVVMVTDDLAAVG